MLWHSEKKALIYDLWLPLHDNTFPITQFNRNIEFNINLGHEYVHYISLHYLKKWKNYSDPSMLFYVSSSSSQMPALILHPSCHLIFLCSSLPFSFQLLHSVFMAKLFAVQWAKQELLAFPVFPPSAFMLFILSSTQLTLKTILCPLLLHTAYLLLHKPSWLHSLQSAGQRRHSLSVA